jgi:hypothetical protein
MFFSRRSELLLWFSFVLATALGVASAAITTHNFPSWGLLPNIASSGVVAVLGWLAFAFCLSKAGL